MLKGENSLPHELTATNTCKCFR